MFPEKNPTVQVDGLSSSSPATVLKAAELVCGACCAEQCATSAIHSNHGSMGSQDRALRPQLRVECGGGCEYRWQLWPRSPLPWVLLESIPAKGILTICRECLPATLLAFRPQTRVGGRLSLDPQTNLPKRGYSSLDSCCQDKSSELEALRGHQSKVLWIALAINGGMFGLEFFVGLLTGSTSLLADSLDMLGDALVYGFTLYVVGLSTRWQASAALLKGIVMAGFGLMVLAQAGYHLMSPEVPDFRIMGATGVLALLANGTCLLLLTRRRNDDLNMRSTWLCSRNDIIANVGILIAAAGVLASGSKWPDLAIGLLITAVYMRSAVYVIRQATTALRDAGYKETTTEAGQPVV